MASLATSGKQLTLCVLGLLDRAAAQLVGTSRVSHATTLQQPRHFDATTRHQRRDATPQPTPRGFRPAATVAINDFAAIPHAR